MGSIQHVLSASSLGETNPHCKGHHLKTLDIGLNGNTVSTNPYGDVIHFPLVTEIFLSSDR